MLFMNGISNVVTYDTIDNMQNADTSTLSPGQLVYLSFSATEGYNPGPYYYSINTANAPSTAIYVNNSSSCFIPADSSWMYVAADGQISKNNMPALAANETYIGDANNNVSTVSLGGYLAYTFNSGGSTTNTTVTITSDLILLNDVIVPIFTFVGTNCYIRGVTVDTGSCVLRFNTGPISYNVQIFGFRSLST